MTSADFCEFWLAYPRKIGGKIAARTAYDRALKKIDANSLLEGAKRLAKEGREQKFIPHPTTWLNQGRWTDYESQPLEVPSFAPEGVYLNFTNRDVWDDYGRKIGKSWPRDRAGGWWFPSRYPPNHEEPNARNHAQPPRP